MRDPRRVALRLLALAAAALVAAALALGGGTVDARRSDAFCVSCHRDTSHRPGHAGVACQPWHSTAEAGGVRLVLAAAHLGPAPAHGGTRVVLVQCHREDTSRWRSITANAEHRRHRAPRRDGLRAVPRDLAAQPPHAARRVCAVPRRHPDARRAPRRRRPAPRATPSPRAPRRRAPAP
ncbi:MAG: hypothetical protein U0325_31110 [Polyangiales bacterium]